MVFLLNLFFKVMSTYFYRKVKKSEYAIDALRTSSHQFSNVFTGVHLFQLREEMNDEKDDVRCWLLV